MADRFDATTYGRSFADVYDDWYPAGASTLDAVDRLDEMVGRRPADLLELGVGTGRLAVPLAARGHRVTGADASPEMLALLAAKQGGSHPPITGVHADVARRDEWPGGPFDVVLAAFNMVFNLTDPVAQASLFTSAFDVLRPGGSFVVECFVPAPHDAGAARLLELRSVELDRVVLIATESDPETAVVTGQHIELRDGEPVRLRPWQIRAVPPAELDRWACAAGFTVVSRSCDWRGTPFEADSTSHVSVFRRPA